MQIKEEVIYILKGFDNFYRFNADISGSLFLGPVMGGAPNLIIPAVIVIPITVDFKVTGFVL